MVPGEKRSGVDLDDTAVDTKRAGAVETAIGVSSEEEEAELGNRKLASATAGEGRLEVHGVQVAAGEVTWSSDLSRCSVGQ